MPNLNNYCVWAQGDERDWRLIAAETPLDAAERARSDGLGIPEDVWGCGAVQPIYCVEDEARKVTRFRSVGEDHEIKLQAMRERRKAKSRPTPLLDWLERKGGVN